MLELAHLSPRIVWYPLSRLRNWHWCLLRWHFGQQITSIPAYRQWLKDQKAYAAKVSHGVPDEL